MCKSRFHQLTYRDFIKFVPLIIEEKSTWKCFCQKWKALMKNLNLLSTLFLVYDKSYREVL